MSEMGNLEWGHLEADLYTNIHWVICVDCEAEFLMKPQSSLIRCPRCGSIRVADPAIESITEARTSHD